ncbi:hypothetical protein BKA61DRAFT_198202 [Leptodontidium sp. MPI-SDFR-AT-0119]|nr:hypothetical protein BKA61DRAFT_198202 [Leptodontidium sp. MPI-SDFR-AT-0119]
MEPIGVTLGAIALLCPIYNACNQLYHGYSLTRAFGSDFLMNQFELEMQWCRLDVTSRRRLIDLETPLQLGNTEHSQTQTIVRALSLIKNQFELANTLMKKYAKEDHDRKPSDDAISTGASSSAAFSISRFPSTASNKTISPSSTNPATPSSSTSMSLGKEVGKKTVAAQVKSAFRRPFRRRNPKDDSSQAPPTAGPLTGVSPPVAAGALLDSALVLASQQDQIQQRDDLNDSTTFCRKALWVKTDREAFHRVIKVLKDLNSFLETVLAMKPTKDPTRLLESTETENENASWLPEAKNVQGTLMRLHDSLRHMNTPGNGHDMWNLSIKLASNFQEIQNGIVNNLYGLKLRDQEGARYFQLKRQKRELHDTASMFIAEIMPDDPSHNRTTATKSMSTPAWHLDQAISLQEVKVDSTFDDWGTVWSATCPDDLHRLFHAEDQVSQKSGALPDLLKSEHAAMMTPSQRADLAHLIAISYFHFSLVRPSCSDITPYNFCYYSAGAGDDGWVGDDLLILKPYLDFGFGRRPPPTLWESSGVSKTQSNVIVGLGLILFQIGCCIVLPQNKSLQALDKAKRTVLSNLHLLDVRVSSAFAEVTEACLQYSPAVARKYGGSVDKFLEGVVSRLLSLQESLEMRI